MFLACECLETESTAVMVDGDVMSACTAVSKGLGLFWLLAFDFRFCSHFVPCVSQTNLQASQPLWLASRQRLSVLRFVYSSLYALFCIYYLPLLRQTLSEYVLSTQTQIQISEPAPYPRKPFLVVFWVSVQAPVGSRTNQSFEVNKRVKEVIREYSNTE